MSTTEQAKQFFEICDASGDGKVSKDELRVQMEKKGKSAAEIEKIFSYCDRNSDGSIEFTELTKALFANQWDLIFDELDKDGTGTIDAKEMGGMLDRVEDPAALQRFIDAHDKDGDGSLDRNEFLKWFIKN